MSLRKIISLTILPFFLSSFLLSQSLVELAKKEKERRAKLKGKKSQIVTNEDLAKLKKKPGISILQSSAIPEKRQRTTSPPKSTPTKKPQDLKATDSDKKEFVESEQDLEMRWKKAREHMELLGLKMNALWQQYYSTSDRAAKARVQGEISQTYLQLQKASNDEEIARKELEKIRQQDKK